jgi:hypothetical protein
MSESYNQGGIRLSQLNTEVRDKVKKFDTGNDGSLSIEEAVQGLVALQKQSNNYKRLLYMIVPILVLTLGAVLGCNILSIYLTKDLKVQGQTPVLSDIRGNVVQTATYSLTGTFLDLLQSGSLEQLYSTINIRMDGLNLPVQSVFVEGIGNSTTSVTMSTPFVWFKIVSDGSYDLGYNSWVNPNTDKLGQISYHVLSTNLQLLQQNIVAQQQSDVMFISVTSSVKAGGMGLGGFSCVKRNICL